MAGIAGFLPRGGTGQPENLVRAMLAAIAHRGPDGLAVETCRWGALGVARFASNHDRPQPPGPVGAGSWLVAADVRLDERKALARRFAVAPEACSDADLLGLGWLREPGSFPDEVLGDFAVALLDTEQGRAVCARDPLGVKPLYYADVPEGFAFASEIKALLALPFLPRDLDEETLADFVVGQLDDPARTLYRAVRRVPAFHRLERAPDGSIALIRYGRFADAPCGLAEAPATLRRLLKQAVACRLRGARQPGVLLSGGLDSSSLAVLAAELSVDHGDHTAAHVLGRLRRNARGQ